MDGLNRLVAVFLLLIVVLAGALFIFARLGVLNRLIPTGRLGFLTGLSAQNATITPTLTKTPTPTPSQSNSTAPSVKGGSQIQQVSQVVESQPATKTPARQVTQVTSIPNTGSPTLLLILIPALLATGTRLRSRR